MILALLELTHYTDCLLPNTQFIIQTQTNQLELDMLTADNKACIFPPGISLKLRFSNTTLDVQTVLTNYSQFNNTVVYFPVSNASEYLTIQAVTLSVNSYSATYLHEIQEVVILRSNEAQVIDKIDDAKFDGTDVTITLAMNAVITDKVTSGIYNICTQTCQQFNSKSATQTGSIVVFVFETPALQNLISLYGIKAEELTISYGDKVQSSAVTSQFSLNLTYQVPIGVITDAFLYIDSVYVRIESSAAFKAFLRGYNTVGISFFYETCSYDLEVPSSDLDQPDNNIDFLYNKNMFKNQSQFLDCQDQAFKANQSLKLDLNLTNASGTARYVVSAITTQSCFFDTNFTIFDSQMTIETFMTQTCQLDMGAYTLQIQSYASIQDQTTDNKIVLFEFPINLTLQNKQEIQLKQNKTLEKQIIKAYSVFFVLVRDGSEEDDATMKITFIQQKQFYIYIGVMLGLQFALTALITSVIVFVKCKPPKRRKVVKNIAIEDLQ